MNKVVGCESSAAIVRPLSPHVGPSGKRDSGAQIGMVREGTTFWGLWRRRLETNDQPGDQPGERPGDPPGGEHLPPPDGTAQLLAALVDRLDLFPWEADPQTTELNWVGPQVKRVLGHDPEQFLTTPHFLSSIVHPDDQGRLTALLSPTASRERDHEVEFRVLDSRGSTRWLRSYVRLVPDPATGRTRMLGLMLDVSPERLAEQTLRQSERRFRALYENAVYGMYRVTVDGLIRDANPALAEMLGYSSATALIGRSTPVDIYWDAADRQRLVEQFTDGRPFGIAETLWRRADGSPLAVRLTARPERAADGTVTAFEMIAENLSERRALEQQLLDAQKLEAIGRLAGGIAHDFNNLLTVIAGYAALLHERLGSDERALRYTDGIARASERAAALTQQLLAFGRRQVLQPRVVQVNAIIADLDRMLRRLIGEDIELVTLLDPAAWTVRVDPSQLEQVVMNLVLNARDAISGGGRVTIETRNVPAGAPELLETPELLRRDYLQIVVADDGEGIDEETRRHIFEPFYTTKQPGKGSGLGLATVYGVVRQSGGQIVVSSEPGHGARFTIYFPHADAPPDAAVTPIASVDVPGGRETILVVEDEEAVRSLTCQVLRTRGYRVLEARHGAEALDVVARHPAAIDLLLTDLVMPQLGGRELVAKLAPTRPGLRVLYVSGYSDQILFGADDLGALAAFLQKPFSPDRLARKVREILDRPIARIDLPAQPS
jgi:PAS domain S-box-containing protein